MRGSGSFACRSTGSVPVLTARSNKPSPLTSRRAISQMGGDPLSGCFPVTVSIARIYKYARAMVSHNN